jgi:hypothetical protein
MWIRGDQSAKVEEGVCERDKAISDVIWGREGVEWVYR